ncbi:MAG: hypothetical protein LQ343_004470 [Gyalolechia ehrenbergii]|nr:MAG: hypothetical protein LQ343_004470 [Gyalolechia ehrenbergii]
MPKLKGAADNAFNRERLAVKQHAAASSDLWRKLSIYVAIPSIILASINARNLWVEHWEHWETLPPLEDRIEYDYMNIRTKKFFWGDGDKASKNSFTQALALADSLPQLERQSQLSSQG